VAFLGTIPRRELVERYRRAAIFCLPSRQEGFGIVFLEAMACSKPVVAARAAAVPETVLDGETGLLADPEDPEALARAIHSLLADSERRRAMGEAGRRRVEQYGAHRVAGSFLAGVQAALHGPQESRRRTEATRDVSRVSGEHPPGKAGVGGGR
jgi:glycosyltransferase involved in cell wall biosynthesis